jgi:hypothetical protein
MGELAMAKQVDGHKADGNVDVAGGPKALQLLDWMLSSSGHSSSGSMHALFEMPRLGVKTRGSAMYPLPFSPVVK